jgi:hypothetical protein
MHNTSENITSLAANEIFVFGANKDGWHGAGAAKTAVEKFGAVVGQGEGLQGSSYGIVTMSGWAEFKASAQRFIDFATSNPQLTFLLTRVGCGIASYRDISVSKLFEDTPPNVVKPSGW